METYDQQFAQAMKLKLQRNRQALKASGESVPRSAPSEPKGGFRDGLIQEILAERPGLTREELERDMRLMGY